MRPLSSTDRANELLERSRDLSTLDSSLARVLAGSHGRFVFVGGEAGVGKTTLVRRFCDDQGGTVRVLWGACDGLFTPRPLGPLVDVAAVAGGELEELVRSGARPHEVAAALQHELAAHAPTVLVLEDLHWADEATLDVVRLLAGRLERVPALVLGSYRDDELSRDHPLRIVLGELATDDWIERLRLAPLSPTAVAQLAEPYEIDADELYRNTAGNPFFVTEVLAAGEEEIPHAVRDAVLARTARLSPEARKLLEVVSVATPQAELWFLKVLAGDSIDRLDECLASGVLTAGPDSVAFRHELARLAFEESLTPDRRAALHLNALEALAARSEGTTDQARLAHHADAAGDADAVVRFAPAAAERAASLGAHREAAAQYARALRFASGTSREVRAEFLEQRSHECYVAALYDEAIEAIRQALEHRRELGDRRLEGDLLRSLAQMLWASGRPGEADEAAREAVAVLERLPRGPELAMAYSVLASRCLNAEDLDEAVVWATRAEALAEDIGDTASLVHSLNTIGTSECLSGNPAGWDKLERSRELADREGLDEQVARAFANTAWACVRTRSYDFLDRNIRSWLDYCVEHGLDLWRLHLLAYRACWHLDQGCWTEAVETAGLVTRTPRAAPLPRTLALVVIGLVRARRGDPEVWSPLDEALLLAEPTGELQRVAPVAAARAEAAWLEGRREAVEEETASAFDLALRRRASWVVGELASWRRRGGLSEPIPPHAAQPYALLLRGDWARAAALWAALDCPYEVALALGDSDEDDQLRRALAELQRLEARPAAAIVARRLRERGARGLPRGPRAATRRNPGNLTQRELEVLELVVQGLRNAEIAERLFLSERTIHHHVSAILRKLGVETRGQASAEAMRLGLGQDG